MKTSSFLALVFLLITPDVQASLKDLRAIPKMERAISSLKQEQVRLSSEIKKQETKESELQARHQEVMKNLRTLEAGLLEREHRLRDLQNELSQHQRLEREAEKRYSRLEAEVSSFAEDDKLAELKRLNADLEQTQKNVSHLEMAVASVRNLVKDDETTILAKRVEARAIVGEIESLRVEISSLSSRNRATTLRLSEVAEKVSELQTLSKAPTSSH